MGFLKDTCNLVLCSPAASRHIFVPEVAASETRAPTTICTLPIMAHTPSFPQGTPTLWMACLSLPAPSAVDTDAVVVCPGPSALSGTCNGVLPLANQGALTVERGGPFSSQRVDRPAWLPADECKYPSWSLAPDLFPCVCHAHWLPAGSLVPWLVGA